MKNIEQLIKKYYEGNTSLEEERKLREYFRSTPNISSAEKVLFEYFESERTIQTTVELEAPNTPVIALRRLVWSIAASLIIIVSAFWLINNHSKSSGFDYVVDDPEVALEITKETFAFLNSKLDKGEQTLKENIVHLEKTLIFKNL